MTVEARLNAFVKAIKPTPEHLAEANRQVAFMIERLASKVAKDERFTLEKILKAGSNAKFTSLRKTAENRFDVDLGAYYSGEGATKDHLDKLLRFTRDQLRSIYPQKAESDFECLNSAARVKFTSGIKLYVDVAPIISDGSLHVDNGGWIPRPDGWRLTSVTGHNQFVHRRTAESKTADGPVAFNRLVRMVKWWNNLQGELAQPSIFCELIAAKAFEGASVPLEWNASLRHFFSFMRKHGFREPIIFSDYYDARRVSPALGAGVVMDSVNPANNVVSTWTAATRDSYLGKIQSAYDAVMEARSADLDGDEGAAVEAWSLVFGDAFPSLSEPKDGGA